MAGVGEFIYAIRQQESGGNYTARSPAGALGAYQIMPFNVGNWSQEAIGRRLTVNEFMASPLLQDEVAQYKLTQLYTQYGARGAAAAWYSGNPANASNYTVDRWGQSPGNYADEVSAKMGTAPSGGVLIPPPAYTPTQLHLPLTKQQHDAIVYWCAGFSAVSHGTTGADPNTNIQYWLDHFNKMGDATLIAAFTVLYGKYRLGVHLPDTKTNTTWDPSGVLGGIKKLFDTITSSDFWKRFGLGAMGALILIGMVFWVEKT